MAPKIDPKDERIAELELQLEAAQTSIRTAETSALKVPALETEIENPRSLVSSKDKEIGSLKGQIELLQQGQKCERPTVTNLDGSKAVQLKISSLFTNAMSGALVHAIAGDVIVVASAFEELQKKLGASARIHPVSEEEFKATKQAGRCY